MTSATFRNNPPPLPGWTHSDVLPDDSPGKNGIKLSGNAIVRSSPVIADIDGNAGNGKEVAVAGPNSARNNGLVYAYKSDGSLLWSQPLLPSNCTFPSYDDVANSGPAVGDIDGDGVPEVVVGYGAIGVSNCDGGLAVYSGSDGALQWRFSLRNWQANQGYPAEALYGVVSSPALADVDGDGKMEIGFGGLDRNLYLLNYDGSVRFYYQAADTVWSSPAFVNIDNDAQLEMIIGTDITGNPALQPPTQDGGYVYAFKTNQRNPLRLEFRTGYLWQTYLDQAIYSSPAVGDVLPSSAGNEVIIGSSCSFPYPFDPNNRYGKWIKILRLIDGAVLQTLNAANCIQSSPALGDVDNDGALEIVATVHGNGTFPNGNGKVQAWNPTDPAPVWTAVPKNASDGSNDPYIDDLSSPVIADIDGNGSLEVLVSNVWSVVVLRGADGAQMTCTGSGCSSASALYAWWTVKSTPAVGDINGDNKLDVVIGGAHLYITGGSTGVLYSWTDFESATWMPGTTTSTGQPARGLPWPMFRANPQHTGHNLPAGLSVSPSSIYLLHQLDDPNDEVAIFTITNTGDGALDWTATPPSPAISLSSAAGTLTTQAILTATVDVATYYQSGGTYNLGNITISGTSGGSVVAGSPASIPITLYVGQVSRLFLPLIER